MLQKLLAYSQPLWTCLEWVFLLPCCFYFVFMEMKLYFVLESPCLNSSYCYFALLVRLTTFGFGFLCKIARAVGIFFIFWLFSLCKMCPFSELFWSIFSRIQTEYGKILRISPYSPYSTRTRKNADQNNSEYDHFLRSVFDIYFC